MRTGPTPTRGRRHPVSVMHQARQLHAEGKGDVEIVNILAGQGVTVQRTTIARWTRTDYAERARRHHDRAEGRASRKRGMTPGLIHPSSRPEFSEGRIEALSLLGFDDEAIAVLMSFDTGREVTVDRVRLVLDDRPVQPRFGVGSSPDAQREAALRRANRVRSAAANLKREVREGRLSLEEALMDSRADAVRVGVLLRCLPGWGPARSARALGEAKVGSGELVGCLGEWTRARLVRVVGVMPLHGAIRVDTEEAA